MENWAEQKNILKKLADDQNSAKNTPSRVPASGECGLGTVAVEYVAQKTGLERPLDIEESLKKAVLEEIYKRDRTQSPSDVAAFEMTRIRKGTLKDKFLAKLALRRYVRPRTQCAGGT